MLRSQAGLSDVPKPGCSGTNTSNCLASRSNTGSQTGRPLAPCRNNSGGPEPPRNIRTLTSRTLCFVSVPGMALFSSRTEGQSTGPCPRGNPGINMAAIDTERFRLRRFVERLVQLGECEVHDRPIDLVDVGAVLDGNPRATWFKAVGPEKAELIGNVMGSRKRLALALDTDGAGLLPEITRRLANPHKPIKVAAADAPVQQVVLKSEQADLCALPVHLQHGDDGAPYISAGLDVMQ